MVTFYNRRIASPAIDLLVFALYATDSHAGWLDSASKWYKENMIDAEDGKLDVSDYLASAHGYFPVPIIITEPAVGFGGGLAVAYFHAPKELDEAVHWNTPRKVVCLLEQRKKLREVFTTRSFVFTPSFLLRLSLIVIHQDHGNFRS